MFRNIQIFAWGSLALDVPKRNFRSLSLVSVEKLYNRDSEDYKVGFSRILRQRQLHKLTISA